MLRRAIAAAYVPHQGRAALKRQVTSEGGQLEVEEGVLGRLEFRRRLLFLLFFLGGGRFSVCVPVLVAPRGFNQIRAGVRNTTTNWRRSEISQPVVQNLNRQMFSVI